MLPSAEYSLIRGSVNGENSLLKAALEYHERGWVVFPCKDKRHPHINWGEFQGKLPTREQVIEWWTRWPDAWIALILGDIDRIDADGVDDIPNEMPSTMEFTTPSGGKGWLYPHSPGVRTTVLWRGQGQHQELRVQSAGAYTILPPSPGYVWTNTTMGPVPEWLSAKGIENLTNELAKELQTLPRELATPDDALVLEAFKHLAPLRADDYDSWIKVAMAAQSVGDDRYFDAFVEWSSKSNKFRGEDDCRGYWQKLNPGGNSKGKLTIRSIVYWAKKDDQTWKPKGQYDPLDDNGNAARLARIGDGGILYCWKLQYWLTWDGKRWERDGYPRVEQLWKKELRDWRTETYNRKAKLVAAGAEETNEGKDRLARLEIVRKHILRSNNEPRFSAAIKRARTEVNLMVEPDDLDPDPWLFNCLNGTLDLRTGLLRDHRPSDKIVQLCPTAYWPDAQCPRFTGFLDSVFPRMESVVRWLQKFFGCCLSGVIREHILANFTGSGANGKGALLRTIQKVLGDDYAGSSPRELLIHQKQRGHPTELMTLYRKRLVWASETDQSSRWDEALVKQLTGGDPITARFMHKDFVTFEPTHKLVVATNYPPEVRGTDDGIRRRIKMVPFNVRFWRPEEDGFREGLPLQDDGLEEALLEEASGILRWMVEGCYLWQQEGLGEPREIRTATKEYFDENDYVKKFIDERCRVGAHAKSHRNDFSRAFKEWTALNDVKTLSMHSVTKQLARLGYGKDETGNYYIGIELRS